MAEIGIFVGTMYGNSLLVAEEAEAILTAQGHKATVFEDPELSDWLPYQDKYVLVVTSTTGQGDLPDSIVPLFQGIKDSLGLTAESALWRDCARRQQLCKFLQWRQTVRCLVAGTERSAGWRNTVD